MHNRTIQINHQPDAPIFQFIILTSVYNWTCFVPFPAHHQELNDCSGSLWSYLRIVVTVVLCSWLGRLARPWTQHDCHHDTKVKPEAATAVTELLMMGGKTPETCWAVNKRQDNKLENYCIWLVLIWIIRWWTDLQTLESNLYSYVLCWLAAASSQSTQHMAIPIAVYTELILLMMSSKPARNMFRLIIEIN